MKEYITNAKVTYAKMVTSGTNDKGTWELWKIKVGASGWENEELSLFHRGSSSKPAPVIGLLYKLLEVEIEEYKGKQQWKVGKFEVDETTAPPPPSTGAAKGSPANSNEFPFSMHISYIKDVWIAMRQAQTVNNPKQTLLDAWEEIYTVAHTTRQWSDTNVFRDYLKKKLEKEVKE